MISDCLPEQNGNAPITCFITAINAGIHDSQHALLICRFTHRGLMYSQKNYCIAVWVPHPFVVAFV
jgi:hypothetical protein